MTVRLAVSNDAAPVTTMYNAAVPTIKTFWPDGATRVTTLPQSYWDGRIALGQVYISAATANGAARGFIARRPGLIEAEWGDEMDIWIIPTSSTAAQMRAWTKELWIKWAQDHVALGTPWLWGRNAGNYPAKTETVFQTLRANGLILVKSDATWRVAKMRPADLLNVLAPL